MTRRPVAYVMEQTLGNVTHYLNLRAVAPADEVRWVPVDYTDGKLPWTVRGSVSARTAVAPLLSEVDGLFIHTMTLALGSFDTSFRLPVVVSTDGPALAKRHMRAAYGLPPERNWITELKAALYRPLFARTAGFVAWSAWAKASLVEDYGCRDEDVAVIHPGINLSSFSPVPRENELPRILFVGGDFERKGGRTLLSAFRRALRGRAELVIVTRDAIDREPGVTVLRNVAPNSPELLECFRSSDIFALPSFADCFALVGMEALAAGLPLVATRVGGIPEMVEDGVTGYLFDPGDDAALAERLLALVESAALRKRMSSAARSHAERHFDAVTNAQRLLSFVRSRC